MGFIHLVFFRVDIVGKSDLPALFLQSEAHQTDSGEKFCKSPVCFGFVAARHRFSLHQFAIRIKTFYPPRTTFNNAPASNKKPNPSSPPANPTSRPKVPPPSPTSTTHSPCRPPSSNPTPTSIAASKNPSAPNPSTPTANASNSSSPSSKNSPPRSSPPPPKNPPN